MPVGCRIIEPLNLGAHEVPQDSEDDKKCVLTTVANNAIVGALLQLSSLVRHADDLFCDISDECHRVFERTDALTKRIKKIDVSVGKLDAKHAQVPEGDLKQFTAITQHHAARHGFNSNVFQPGNRPQCVQDLYTLCLPNPTRVIRSADLYRKDGLSGSKMFKCWPVTLNDRSVRTPDLNLPRRIQRVRSFEKKYKQLKIRERPKTICGWEDFNLDDISNEIAEEKNKTNECLTNTEPPTVISIDTSGSNFERMQSLRLSGSRNQTKAERDKKKKRRRTVSGVPDNIMAEIEKFDRKQKSTEGGPRQTPRSYSFDDLDAEDNDIERDEGIVKYLDELDGRMEEKTGEDKALKIMKYFPCRRSRSLPRCIKLESVSRALSADRRSQRGDRDLNTTYGSSCLSIHSMASNTSRLSRSAKRSSMISNKLRSLVTGNTKEKDKQKPRPKSLDIDMILDTKATKRSSIEEHGRSKSTYSLERNHTVKVPDNLLNKEHSEKSESSVGPGSYYNFESSTLPRAQAKKYDFPWESLPKDWTTSVKLREISKRRAREDRQSSSGNWSQSGTNSNRHSLDSDLRSTESNKFTSQYSLGKDSGRDSLTLEEENDCVTDGTSTAGYAADGISTITGSSESVSVVNQKTNFTELDTETWIQSLAIRAAKQEEAQNTDKSSTLSRLTKKNILALDLMLSDKRASKVAEDESSVYSIDADGFYTSFHTDSGLKKSTNTLVDDDDISPTKDTLSICSVESVIQIHINSDKFANLRKGNSANKVLSKVTPPAPPPRTTSSKTLLEEDTKGQFPPELHSFPSQDSSVESDAEAVFTRVHDKTTLSSTGYPSLVALSTSDDESSPEVNFGKTKVNRKGDDYNFDETDSEFGHSNIKDTSRFSYFSSQNGSFLNSKSDTDCFHVATSLKHSKSALECTDQGYNSFTLPKGGQHSGKLTASKGETSYQSWPRSNKSTPSSGILKTPEKPFDSTRPPKSLNFAPVVNLFNPGAHNSVQVPLPSPTNSSASESNFTTSVSTKCPFQTPIVPDQSYQLSFPIQDNTDSKRHKKTESNSNLPLKYQPVISVTPRSRSGDRQGNDRETSGSNVQQQQERTRTYNAKTPRRSSLKPSAQSTPQVVSTSLPRNQTSPNLYAVSPVIGSRHPDRQNSITSSNSSNSEYLDMRTTGSIKSAGSTNSLAWDGIEFNDTYMSMTNPSNCSSPNLSNMDFSISSTPSGSMSSLLDRSKTPTNELETDTYQIVSSVQQNRQGNNRDRVETVPIVTQGKTANSNMSGQMSFSSFRAAEPKSANSSNGSFSSFNSTPGRRSLDSTDNDLTRVTQMSMNSTQGSFSTTPQSNMQSYTARQQARQSRADTRKEPSYRSHDTTHRRSLPSDVSNSINVNVYKRNVPLNDMPKNGQNGQSGHNGHVNHRNPQVQKSMSSSRSCPTGFNNNNNVSNSSSNMGTYGRGSPNSGRHDPKRYSTPPSTPLGTEINDPGQLSNRTDSYRVATGMGNGSYRGAMNSSKSYPVLPLSKHSGPSRVAVGMSPNPKVYNNYEIDDDVMSRADSYRIAVRNTNPIVPPDFNSRNSSYRVAIKDDGPSMLNSKLDALSMDNRKMTGNRDVRRMGITDVDQAKDISGKSSKKVNGTRSTSSLISKPQPQIVSKPQSQITSKPQVNNNKDSNQTIGGRIRKVTKQDVDPIQVVASVDNNNDSKKSNKNSQNRSSTYIQFDPIFEDTEDFGNPDGLGIGNIMSPDVDLTSQDYSLNLSNTSKSKLGLINGSVRDANANNVKGMKKSKSGHNIEIEDNYRFSQV